MATGVLVVMLLLLTYFLRLPPVQTRLIAYAVERLERELGTEVYVNSIRAALPSSIVLEDMAICDEQGAVLLRMNAFRLDVLSLSLWDYLRCRDEVQRLTLRAVRLIKPDVFIYRRPEDGVFNYRFILDHFASDDTVRRAGRLELDLRSLHIEQGAFRYIDSTKADRDLRQAGHFNSHNFRVEQMQADISAFVSPGGRIDAQLLQFSGEEVYAGLHIDHLSFDLLAEDPLPGPDSLPVSPQVRLADISLKTGRTWFTADLHIPDRNLVAAFDVLAPDYVFAADLKSGCRLDFALIDYFLSEPSPLRGEVYAEGQVGGSLYHLESKDLKVSFGQASGFRTVFSIDEPLDTERLLLDVRMRRCVVDFDELGELMPSFSLPPQLRPLRLVALQGRMQGSLRDFQIDIETDTRLGAVQADLHMQLPAGAGRVRYEGQISTRALNLNALGLADFKPSSNLNFDGTVKGQGLALDEVEARFDATITPSDLFGYAIDTVDAEVAIANRKVLGHIRVVDAEGWVGGKVDIDLSTSPGVIRADGQLRRLNLARYGLYEDPVQVSSDLHVDMRGDSLDNLLGDLRFDRTAMVNLRDSSQVQIPSFWMEMSEPSPGFRYLNVKSNLLDADLAGNYTISRAWTLSQRLLYESQLYFANNDSLIRDYYANRKPDSVELDIKVAIGVKDSLNQVLKFFCQPAYIADKTLIISDMQFGVSEQANILVKSDSLYYASLILEGTELDLNLVKLADSNELVIAGGIHSRSFRAGPQFVMEEVSLDVQGADNEFESDIVAYQPRAASLLRIKIKTLLAARGVIRSHIDPATSMLIVREDTLRVREGDSIVYRLGEVLIHNLLLEDAERYVRVHGLISEDPLSKLTLSVAGLNMAFFSEIYPLPYAPGGRLNADIDLAGLTTQPRVQVYSRIDSFELNDFYYGTVFFNGRWDEGVSEIGVDGRLVMDGDSTLVLRGVYNLADSVSPLDFRMLTYEGFPLDYVQPFVEDQIYGIAGTVRLEQFRIRGSLSKLDVKGTGFFRNAAFGVSYFKTAYTFDGRIEFENNRISFPRLRLYDRNRNHADLHGDIVHQGLTDFQFNLQVDSVRNFLVMDTRKEDNDLFYGTVKLKDGIADITGDLEELSVNAFAMTGAGTRLKIPLTDYSTLGRPDYIRFVGEELEAEVERNTGLQGFNLSLTTHATEEAEVELIFDERVGDIIRGRGEGYITMDINASGDFNMYGSYEIRDGDYLFTAQSVLNKRFEVKPGGTLVWNGDPYAATVRLDAVYPLYADIKDLIQSEQSVRTPVNVLMHMAGPLMKPEITLSIELPSLRGQDAEKALATLRSVQFDEQELNKQIFSLMVFNRFAPVGGSLGSDLAGTGVTTSVSELLSNQLNYWLSQATSDKVNINVNTSNFQDINLLVSAKLFNDRVTIERDGTLIQSTGENNTQLQIGNIRVIIRLLPTEQAYTQNENVSNELVLEVFTRESYSAAAQNNTSTTNQTGFGISYEKEFDRLMDLFKRSKTPK